MSSPATIRRAEQHVVDTKDTFLDAVKKLQDAVALLGVDLKRTLHRVDTNRQALMDDIDKRKPGSKAYIVEKAFEAHEKAKADLEDILVKSKNKTSTNNRTSNQRGGKKSKRSGRHNQNKSRRNHK
jgi:non-homologous end joining protein Ku